MVPSGPTAVELWMSPLGNRASAGRLAAVLKLRSKVSRRGPACGLRPVCWASIWYCGLPPPAAAGAGEGEATAATPGDGDGLATGDAAAAADGEAPGDATGAMAGLVVGAVVACAAGTAVIVGCCPWHAASRPVPPRAANWPRCTRKRRRLRSMQLEPSGSCYVCRPTPARRRHEARCDIPALKSPRERNESSKSLTRSLHVTGTPRASPRQCHHPMKGGTKHGDAKHCDSN